MKALDKLKSMFRTPKASHRVIAVAPIGALLSHAFYLFMNSGPKKLGAAVSMNAVDYMSITLVVMVSLFVILWIVFCEEINFRLSSRLLFMAIYGAVAHRLILGASNITGISYFELGFFMLCAFVIAFFVATGKTFHEVENKYEKLTGNNPKDPSRAAIDISKRREHIG